MLEQLKALLGKASAENPREELIEILRASIELLLLPDNDFTWSHWSDSKDAIKELDSLISVVTEGKLPDRVQVSVLFAPTGSLQEVSLSSGWGDYYISLADRFDAVEKRLWPEQT